MFHKKVWKDKSYTKVKDHCHGAVKYRKAAHSICNWIFNVSNGSPIVLTTCQTMIISLSQKKVGNEFEIQFECVGQNREKHKTFSVPTEKEVAKVHKEGNGKIITISC